MTPKTTLAFAAAATMCVALAAPRAAHARERRPTITVERRAADGKWAHTPVMRNPIRRALFNLAHAELSKRGWRQQGYSYISTDALEGAMSPPQTARRYRLVRYVLRPLFNITRPGFAGNFTRAYRSISAVPRRPAAGD